MSCHQAKCVLQPHNYIFIVTENQLRLHLSKDSGVIFDLSSTVMFECYQQIHVNKTTLCSEKNTHFYFAITSAKEDRCS